MPVPAGAATPKAPANFVRDKDDPKKQAARLARAQAAQIASRVQAGTAVQTPVGTSVEEADIAF